LTGGDGSCLNAEESRFSTSYGEVALSDQAVVDHFCHASLTHGNSHLATSTTASTSAMFFTSSVNSCGGSVTVKSQLCRELNTPAVSGASSSVHAGLPITEAAESRQEFWKWETPPRGDDSSPFASFRGHNETGCLPRQIDACPGRLSVYTSPDPDSAPTSMTEASFGTMLSHRELPAPVRSLLTPPDSLPVSPHYDPTDDETMDSLDRVGCPTPSTSSGSPDEASSPLEDNSGFLVLTPVTRRPRRTHPGCTTIKYNRKNNNSMAELDRRRVHFCDFPG